MILKIFEPNMKNINYRRKTIFKLGLPENFRRKFSPNIIKSFIFGFLQYTSYFACIFYILQELYITYKVKTNGAYILSPWIVCDLNNFLFNFPESCLASKDILRP